MNKLVALVFGPDDQVKEDVAAQIIAGLSRSELKRFLAAFRLEMRRRIVQVALAGEGGPGLGATLARTYPGRRLDIAKDEALGAGVKVSAGDDVVDASVHGYIREIIEELGGI
jgi:ATP synthase delta (OSCP) subunit